MFRFLCSVLCSDFSPALDSARSAPRRRIWTVRVEWFQVTNDSTISEPARQVLAIVQSSETLKSHVEQYSELRAYLIQAADAAANSSDLSRLLEAVSLAACTGDRDFEARWSDNSNGAELAELKLLASQAYEHLGAVLREFCPEARPIGVIAPPAN